MTKVEKQDKHIQIMSGGDYRMVVISDIHGHAGIFRDLLGKVNLKSSDYLVIIGDFINKGPDSLEVLKIIMPLAQRPNTYILKGNHESYIISHLQSETKFSEMLRIMQKEPYELIFHDMAKALNFDIFNCQDSEIFRQMLLEKFEEEFHFLTTRPILLENESFIFVHGGYEKELCPERDESKLLKYDFFNDKSPVHDKTIIVGHWPACNLRTDIMTNRPFFNDEKNIITIDGGLGVKSSGELNALIINSKDEEITYEIIQSNVFKKKIIAKALIMPKEELTFVNYPHSDIEIKERNHQFTKCLHLHSGKAFSVFNALLDKDGEKDCIKVSYINRFFDLSEGDQVEVCKVFDDCILVKYQQEFGWILPEQIEN